MRNRNGKEKGGVASSIAEFFAFGRQSPPLEQMMTDLENFSPATKGAPVSRFPRLAFREDSPQPEQQFRLPGTRLDAENNRVIRQPDSPPPSALGHFAEAWLRRQRDQQVIDGVFGGRSLDIMPEARLLMQSHRADVAAAERIIGFSLQSLIAGQLDTNQMVVDLVGDGGLKGWEEETTTRRFFKEGGQPEREIIKTQEKNYNVRPGAVAETGAALTPPITIGGGRVSKCEVRAAASGPGAEAGVIHQNDTHIGWARAGSDGVAAAACSESSVRAGTMSIGPAQLFTVRIRG